MATEEQKKTRQIRLFNDIIFGFAKGLYDLFGEASLATVDTIGSYVLEDMEHELGLEIQGETPQDILTEIERLLVDEYGLCESITLDLEDDKIDLVCQNCMLWKATLDLQAENVPPYTCVPMTLSGSALRKRLGVKARFVSLEQDMENRICHIDFRLLS
jgi:hypothetical protein